MTQKAEPKIDIIQACLIKIEGDGVGKFNMDIYNIPPIITSRFILTHEIGLIQKKESRLSASQRLKTIDLFDKVQQDPTI